MQAVLTPDEAVIKDVLIRSPRNAHQFTLQYQQYVYDWLYRHKKDIIQNGNIIMLDWLHDTALTHYAVQLNKHKIS